ncbi:MAG: hypothetical protein JOZ74_10925 [Bradyrhizobium sp.]|nr:hypothetical protein [Bradyrhizobium sp.]
MRLFFALPAVALLASAAHAVPGERDRLNACKAMVERAAPSPAARQTAELQKCRQIIKEWTLRDSRMSVDENGKPVQ